MPKALADVSSQVATIAAMSQGTGRSSDLIAYEGGQSLVGTGGRENNEDIKPSSTR